MEFATVGLIGKTSRNQGRKPQLLKHLLLFNKTCAVFCEENTANKTGLLMVLSQPVSKRLGKQADSAIVFGGDGNAWCRRVLRIQCLGLWA